MVGDCFGERPAAAPLPHRLRKQQRAGAAHRWGGADSRTVGAIQQSAVRGATLESRPLRERTLIGSGRVPTSKPLSLA
jgi:hypothetical protein